MFFKLENVKATGCFNCR